MKTMTERRGRETPGGGARGAVVRLAATLAVTVALGSCVLREDMFGAIGAVGAGGAPLHLRGAHGFTLGPIPLPSRDDLAAMMATPAPPPPSATTADVTQWELAGPFPAALGEPVADDHPSQPLLRAVLGESYARSGRPAALHCLAREEARFRLRHSAPMPHGLTDLVKSRCGMTHRDLYVDHVYQHGLDARVPDAEVLRSFSELASRRVADAIPPNESREVGAALVREGTSAMLVVVYARPVATLSVGPRARDARGNVFLRGRLAQTPERLDAYITQGPLGVAACTFDPGVSRPDFVLSCPMAASDTHAAVELYTRPEGAIVERAEFAVDVGDVAAMPRTFSRPPAPATRPTVPAQRAALVAALNGARAQVGAPPLRVSEPQSEHLCAMAPWFVGAARGLIPEAQSDRFYLGAGAGHYLDEYIRDANALTHVSFTRDADAALAEQLSRPIARRALLRPAMDRVAVCPAVDDRGTLVAVVWALYDVLRAEERASDAAALLASLDAERARRRLTPLPRSPAAAAAAERAVLRLMGAGVTPQAAMAEALAEAHQTDGTVVTNGRAQTVEAWWSLGVSSPSLSLPDGATYGPTRGIGVAIAYLPRPGGRWGARVALWVGMRPVAE